MILPFEDGVLRTLVPGDAPAIAALINDRSIWLQLRDSVPHPYAVEHAEMFLTRIGGASTHVLGITTQERLAGIIGAYGLDDVERQGAELGYWIGVPFQGMGLATRALRTFIPHVFSTSPFRRLQANVFEGNQASMRVLHKCGFKPEGILRKAVTKDGHALDMHVFGLLKADLS